MVTVAQLVAQVSVSGADKAKSDLEGVGGVVNKVGGFLGNALVGAAVAGGTALIGIGVKSVQMAADYQQSMTMIKSLTGSTAEQMASFDTGVKQLAMDTGKSTTELTQGLYQVISAGFKGGDAMKNMTDSAHDSVIGMTDMETTTKALVVALGAYSLGAKDADNVSNEMLKTVSLGRMTMGDYAGALSTGAAAAHANKVSMEAMNATIATLTSGGVKTAGVAMTDFTQLLNSMDTKTDLMAQRIHSLGLKFDENKFKTMSYTQQVAYLEDVMKGHEGMDAYITSSKNAGQALQVLGTHMGMFKDDLSQLSDKQKLAAASAQAWADTQAGFNVSMQRFRQTINVLMIDLGSALLPLFGKILNAISPLIGKLADWISSNMEPALKSIGQWLKPIGDMFYNTFHSAMSQIEPLLSKINFKPLLDTISGFFSHIDFKGLLDNFGHIAANMSPAVNLFQAISSHAQELGQWFQTSVVPALRQAEPGFKKLGEAIGGLLPAMSKISDVVHDVFQKAFNALLPIFEKAIPIIIQIAGIISNGLGSAIKFLTPYVVQATQAIGKFAGDIITRVVPIIMQWFSQMQSGLNTFMHVWNTVWPILAPILKGVWDQIVGVVKIAWALLSGIIKIGLDILSGNWGQAWEDFKDMLAGVWDGIETYMRGVWEIIKGIFTGGVRALVIAFKPLLEAMSNIPGPVGDMAKKVLSSFDNMNQGAQRSTLQMKEKVLAHSAQMHVLAANELEKMRQEIIQKINNTSDPVQKKILEMKEKSVAQMEQMHKQAAEKAIAMQHDVVQSMSNMQDQVVGHSIIPDMVNSVVAWFAQLPGRAMAGVNSLVSQASSKLSGMASQALTWGSDLVNNMAAGIQAGIGAVTTAASNVASAISSILHHSKPEIGPLAHDDEWMPDFLENLASGLNNNLSKVKNASLNVAATIANPNSQSSFASSSTGGLGGLSVVPSSVSQGATPINITVQSAPVYLDGKILSQGILGPLVNQIRAGTGTFNF